MNEEPNLPELNSSKVSEEAKDCVLSNIKIQFRNVNKETKQADDSK